ncbi:hypothetical protein [Bradyrhizobium sp. SBR1B]|uniref:hypothetical protein n=1 Tax=Bradyrhizobium sp. SBR1B TaxID=2663836 RepID=UPI00160683AC|nr:hypothetical protein [Bradyrhizobium sp. SBR1B]MBB4382533.1 hypothetical protein [Bradyrhizobium sp. SBR1B]
MAYDVWGETLAPGMSSCCKRLKRLAGIKPNDRGYYGFLHADGEAQDHYFTDRTVINCDVPLLVGARVRFWYDDNGANGRAYRVEPVEEE